MRSQQKTISPKDVTKLHLSFAHPVKLTGLSAKVTPSTKERFRHLIEKGYNAEDLIRVACEAYEMQILEMETSLKSGLTKRKLQMLQKQG